MDRYDTDLWKFLQEKNEKLLGISDRLELAKKFMDKVEEIETKDVHHCDLKPQNVLVNLKQDGQWNEQIEITDFGIAELKNKHGKRVGGGHQGTSGWCHPDQIARGRDGDDHAARLIIFMILLSWNRAWSFIWDEITTVGETNPIEKLFIGCKWSTSDSNRIPDRFPEFPRRMGSLLPFSLK